MDPAIHPRPLRQRKKTLQNDIVRKIRDAILDGSHPAGSRLSNQTEFANQFQVSGFTVHRALDQLAREGFIRKQPKLGTRVVDVLPHLTNLALLIPHNPETNKYLSKFYQAMAQAAVNLQHDTQRNVFQFQGMHRLVDSEDRRRLFEYIKAQRLAGIIFASPPYELVDTPIMDEPGIPRVSFATKQSYPHVPAVAFDEKSFFEKALDYLAARGRKRVAILLVPKILSREPDHYLQEAIAKRGMVSPPRWQLTLGQLEAPLGANHCVQLLMHGPASERPDALIIADDNLVEYAHAGLIASGVRVPDDVTVVEHCNFPWPRSALATCRLGLDVHHVFHTCVEIIDRQRRGEQVPGLTRVHAVFEEELFTGPRSSTQ